MGMKLRKKQQWRFSVNYPIGPNRYPQYDCFIEGAVGKSCEASGVCFRYSQEEHTPSEMMRDMHWLFESKVKATRFKDRVLALNLDGVEIRISLVE